jgi:hypothetical protein
MIQAWKAEPSRIKGCLEILKLLIEVGGDEWGYHCQKIFHGRVQTTYLSAGSLASFLTRERSIQEVLIFKVKPAWLMIIILVILRVFLMPDLKGLFRRNPTEIRGYC